MGRILFLSAMAFVAYRYIARSNQRHLPPAPPKGSVEVLPPAPAAAKPSLPTVATETAPHARLIGAATSRAAESDPVR